MKKLTRNVLLGMSLTMTAFAGSAYAAQGGQNDGVTTRADVEARSAAMFARMDVNKDGKIDKADREARQSRSFRPARHRQERPVVARGVQRAAPASRSRVRRCRR